MSLITDDPDESPRDCSRKRHHHHHGSGGCGGCSSHRRRRALIALSSTVASLLSLSLILWLTLRPSGPRFSLLAATATATDNASVILVDAAFAAHNPNARAAPLYDQLRATATYGGVPLSAGAPLPPLEQPEAGQGDALVSALLTSTAAARGDVAVGARALLRVRLEGQLRWKVASWVSGRHGLTVDCVAAVLLQPSPSSSLPPRVADAVGAVQGSQCATHVL